MPSFSAIREAKIADCDECKFSGQAQQLMLYSAIYFFFQWMGAIIDSTRINFKVPRFI